MLRVEFHAEDLHVIAERDIKEKGFWQVNVSDSFDNKFQVVSFTDVELGFLLLLVAAGDESAALDVIPAPMMEFMVETFTEVRPFP